MTVSNSGLSILLTTPDGEAVKAEAVAKELGWNVDEEARRDDAYAGCLLLGRTGDLQCAIQDDGEDAATLAYHLNIEWLLDLRPGHRRIINTRYKLGNSFSTFDVAPDNIAEIEAHFSPHSRSKTAGDEPNLRRRLLESEPIDSIETVLIRKLAEARRVAASHSSGDPQRVDQDVHMLISQLFVLRAIEDLQEYSTVNVPRLRQYLKLEDGKDSFLDQMFTEAANQIEPALFEERPYKRLSSYAVRLIIESLYEVRAAGSNTQLNFGWIHPDVFGRVYERYTATVLAEAPDPPQASLFTDDVRDVSEHSVRKQRGVYYTPWPIVHLLVRHSMDTILANGFDVDNPPRIADLTCGSGAFLLRALDELIGRHPQSGRAEFARRLIQGQHIVGVDIDSRVVSLARILLYLRLLQERIELPLPTVSTCVVAGDALATELPDQIQGLEFDAVVGNPPFVPHTIIPFPEEFRSRFTSAVRRFDYSSLFVERSLKLVKSKGAVALVVPNRLFTSTSAAPIRKLIRDLASIELIVDFGSYEVFAGVSAYIGLISLQRDGSTDHSARIVQAHSLRSANDLWLVHGAVFSQNLDETSILSRFEVSQSDFSDAWHFQDPRTAELFALLNQDAVPLNELALVRQGIKTGANSVFILDQIDAPSDGFIRVRTEEGRELILEETYLWPTASGGEIYRYRSFRLDPCPRLLLMPYFDRGIVPEAQLEIEAPRVFAYLQSQRNILQARSSLRSASRIWYEFAEVRDEQWRNSQKLLIRDLVPNVAFAIDEDGTVQPVGGTSIIPQDPGILYNLAGILNSAVFDTWLSRQSSSFKGAFYKIEPGRLAIAPVPIALLESEVLCDLVTHLLSENSEISVLSKEIDDLIRANLVGGNT